ncbi:MAG: FixH family protein [Nitrospirae bacterium]|nr:FixH family protein [Nitrospirota bacterium]
MKKTAASAALAAILTLTLAFTGCKAKEPEQAAPAAAEAPAPASAPLAATIALKYAPDPPVALKDTAFTINVTGADGKPLPGATVMLDLSMPGMYHGENRPVLAETAPGVYEGKGILTMGGGWLAKVEVTHECSTAASEFRFDAVDK